MQLYTNGTGLSLDNYTFSLKNAATYEIGGIKLKYSADLNDDANILADNTTSAKNYAVKTTKSGIAYVNIPWQNDNTTYSLSGAFAAESSTTISSKIVKGYVYTNTLTANSGSTTTSAIGLFAGDNVTLTTNGTNILISSSNTWREVKAYKSSNEHNLETALATGISTAALQFG
jgi:hypothetical protein